MITIEEEVILAQRIREGDQTALQRLTNANLRFVVSVAKQYRNQGLTLGDLINEGNLGLIKAAKRFDETKGFKFISYAVWWIRQSILAAIAENSRIVRLPLNKLGQISKLNKTYSKLEQEFERDPTPEELSQEMDITLEKIGETFANSRYALSLDMPFQIESHDENNLLDVLDNGEVAPDQSLIEESLSAEVRKALSILSERERAIIIFFFGIGGFSPASLEEIGERFNLTRERARQIKEKSLKKLRQHSKSIGLKSFL